MSLAGSQEGVPAYTLTSFANVPEFAKHRTGPGRTEGKCGSREVELFIPDFLPSPNPTRGRGGGARKSHGHFSVRISEGSTGPHPPPMVSSLPAFLPARDKRAGREKDGRLRPLTRPGRCCPVSTPAGSGQL